MANKLQEKVKNWFKSLKEKYHLSLINKDSFEELYSWQVSKGMFLSAVLTLIILVFFCSILIISYTPIKRVVPGFESDEMHQELVYMQEKLLEMEQEINGKLKYVSQLENVYSSISTDGEEIYSDTLSPNHSGELKTVTPLSTYHFFKPVGGVISQEFSVPNRHYGIDLVCKKNETVKTVLGGKVILSSWTVEEGNVIAIQHQDNLISFYKHNSVLLKRKGDLVKAGDIVAVVGNSGELTSGPHLHLEIWQNGTPLNPADLMDFE